MCDLNEITRIAQQEKNEQLREEKEEEIKKIHKMKFLLSIVKSANAKEMDVEDPGSLNRKLKILFVQDALKLKKPNCLLNLKNFRQIELSYIERKVLREYVINKIKEKCKPLVEIAKVAKKDHPDLYKPEVLHKTIADLKNKCDNLQKQIVEVTNQKCELLKECLEVLTDSSTSNEFELLLTNFKMSQAVAEDLEGTMIEEFITGDEHTEQAVKIVAQNIESLLENE